MEYSVKDLVKILLKRWYIILLVVGITVAASYFLSDRSYQQATKDYNTYTTAVQQVEVKTGTLTAAYSIRPQTSNENFIQAYTNFLVHHNYTDSDSTPTMDEIADFAIKSLEPHMESLMLNKDILATANIPATDISYSNQTNVTTPGTASPPPAKPIEVRYLGDGVFHITLTKVGEADAQQTLQVYIKELTQTISTPTLPYQIDKVSYVFSPDKPVLTDSAQLAQLVMTNPANPDAAQTRTQTSVIIKRMCIAGIFSFAFACIFVLVVTFIRDSAASDKKKVEKTPENSESLNDHNT